MPDIRGPLERPAETSKEENRSSAQSFAQTQYEPTLSPRDVHLVRLEDLRRQQNEELLVRISAVACFTQLHFVKHR